MSLLVIIAKWVFIVINDPVIALAPGAGLGLGSVVALQDAIQHLDDVGDVGSPIHLADLGHEVWVVAVSNIFCTILEKTHMHQERIHTVEESVSAFRCAKVNAWKDARMSGSIGE
jgi:hypothetical protein